MFNLPTDILVYKILISFIINTAPTFKEALQPVINLSATDKYCKAILEQTKHKAALYKALLYNDHLATTLSAVTTAQKAQQMLCDIAENNNLIHPYYIRSSEKDMLYISQFVINVLKQKGASLNGAIPIGNSPLIMAIINHGQSYFIEALLIHKANVNQKNKDGSTPLMLARKHGETTAYNILLNHGANLNAQDNNGHTVYCCYYTYLNNNL